jgi:hypothetical protein
MNESKVKNFFNFALKTLAAPAILSPKLPLEALASNIYLGRYLVLAQ